MPILNEQLDPDIRGQVARLLLEHVDGESNKKTLLAQRDIAEMLGANWNSVHESLKSLYSEGIIRIERNRIILNKELIQKAAGVAF
jgi:Mn-dependent DtxR family transcriptional regulator